MNQSLKSFFTHLECTYCGQKFDKTIVNRLCGICGKVLFAKYDLLSAAQFINPEIIKNRAPNMWRYFEVLSSISIKDLNKLKKDAINSKANPRDIKFDLGIEIVTRFHDKNDAEKAKNDFLNIFQKNKNPEDLDLVEVNAMPLPNLLKHIDFVSSTSEARRLIAQKALKINDNVVSSIDEELSEGTYLLKLGKKKFIKVKITGI